MNTTAYSQSEFKARQQQRAEQMQAALAADPGYQSAARVLEKAQADLDHLQTFIANQRTLERRLQYNPNLVEAKANVIQAEKNALTARNVVFHQANLAKLEEQKQARNQAQTEQQQKRAKELEQEMKVEYRAVWQGDQASFDAAWPGLYQRELETRAIEQRQAVKHYMGQRYAL